MQLFPGGMPPHQPSRSMPNDSLSLTLRERGCACSSSGAAECWEQAVGNAMEYAEELLPLLQAATGHPALAVLHLLVHVCWNAGPMEAHANKG